MFYGNSGYTVYVYTHCQVRLCNSLQFGMYFSTCKRECGAHIVAVSEISDVALSSSWWRSLVCIYEVRDGSWKFSSSGTLMCFMKEHPLIFFFFFPRNEGRWDQGILLCADTSQEWQAAALGIHGSQAWSLARTSRLPEKSSSQHKRGWKREGKNLHFSELHLSLKNGQLLNSLKARLCFIYLSLARAKYPVQSRSSCRMRE